MFIGIVSWHIDEHDIVSLTLSGGSAFSVIKKNDVHNDPVYHRFVACDYKQVKHIGGSVTTLKEGLELLNDEPDKVTYSIVHYYSRLSFRLFVCLCSVNIIRCILYRLCGSTESTWT